MSDIFRGISAFPITPCNAAGQVDTANLQSLVGHLCDTEVSSIGLLGSTGTYAYLDPSERLRAVEAAAEVKGYTPLIVGVGALRTDTAVNLARDAAEAGADGLLLAPVSYTPLTEDEAYAHFVAVADATELPLCIYNNPSTTHFNFSHALLRRLADHPLICGVKMPLPAGGAIVDDLAGLRAVLPADFVIGYSGDWGFTEAMQTGADAFFTALGGTIPRVFVTLGDAIKASDQDLVAALDERLAPLWSLCRRYGSLRLAYALAARLGLSNAQLPLPLLPLGADAVSDLDRWLAECADLVG
jgi:4-hydroxy-tetrahydrodipicolinate synthase